MVAPRLSHDQRENIVLTELEKSFPNFTGQNLTWVKVPDGQDPPDFISQGPSGPIGLELVEWLDGGQMGPAKTRESRREEVHSLLTLDWESRFRPKHFRAAFPWLAGTEKISRNDQPRLREEFFSLAAEVDRNWHAEERWGNHYLEMDFSAYPTLKKYLGAINFLGGVPDENCWIHRNGDGGAFDPYAVVRTLENALKNKISKYSTTEKQEHLKAHGLTELDLLGEGAAFGDFQDVVAKMARGPIPERDFSLALDHLGSAFADEAKVMVPVNSVEHLLLDVKSISHEIGVYGWYLRGAGVPEPVTSAIETVTGGLAAASHAGYELSRVVRSAVFRCSARESVVRAVGARVTKVELEGGATARPAANTSMQV